MVKEAVQLLVDIGLVDVILPFILVFIVMFGILQRTKVLGHEPIKTRKLNALVAFVFGFIAVLATNVLNAVNVLMKYFVLALVVVLMIALIFGLAGGNLAKGKAFKWIAAALFVIAILLALSELGIIDRERFYTLVLPILLIAAVIGGIAYALAKKKGGEGKKEAPKKKEEATGRLTGEQLEKGARDVE